ncbi:glycosyltransferase [Aquipuribacter sp. MA13-6]|uniref:glycosyltransferase n=1 Tax=unclassified Aquipuribacter TaxID=2635084 RepID=UPI003EEACA07
MTGSGTTVGLLSTYPPTQCGLATFTAALAEHLGGAPGAVGVVRVLDPDEPPRVAADDRRVVGHLVNGSARSLEAAARLLSSYDVAVVQHEYGIYGGADGRDVLDLVDALTVPLVVVTHTVLLTPTDAQRDILLRLLESAAHVVTMTRTARERLVSHYGADPATVSVVPHGATDHRAVGPAVRAARPSPRRPTVLTWGLLGPGKGIEWAIDALAELRDLDPRYVVLGRTHPKVLATVGDGYRDGLVRRAAERGVSDLVDFDASYLDGPDLARRVAAADVVLLPYDSLEQVTSGVLIEAVAAGRPVVSTGFPHAVELLGDGTGLLVPREDPAAIAFALRRVLSDPDLARTLAERAEQRAPELVWPAVAQRYRDIACAVHATGPRPTTLTVSS